MIQLRVDSVRDYFRIWFHWKLYAILSFCFIVLFTIFLMFSKTQMYSSSAKVLLLPSSNENAIVNIGVNEKRLNPVMPTDVNTELTLLKSNDVLLKTIKSFQNDTSNSPGFSLRKKKKGWMFLIVKTFKNQINNTLVFLKLVEPMSEIDANLQLLSKSLTVEAVPISNIINLSLKAEDPNTAAIVLNRLLNIYVEHHDNLFNQRQGLDFFNAQSENVKNKLSEYQSRINKFRTEENVIDPEIETQSKMQLLNQLEIEVQNIDFQIEEKKEKIITLKELIEQGNDELIVIKEIIQIPSINELQKSLASLLFKKSEISRDFTNESREFADIKNQIDNLIVEINKSAKMTLKNYELEINSMIVRKNSLVKKINEIQKSAIRLNQIDDNLKGLLTSEEMFKNYLNLYTSKQEEAKVNIDKVNSRLSNVVIADFADISSVPDSPNRVLMLMVAIFMGCIAFIFVPFFLEILDSRIKSPIHAQSVFGSPVIAMIPIQSKN